MKNCRHLISTICCLIIAFFASSNNAVYAELGYSLPIKLEQFEDRLRANLKERDKSDDLILDGRIASSHVDYKTKSNLKLQIITGSYRLGQALGPTLVSQIDLKGDIKGPSGVNLVSALIKVVLPQITEEQMKKMVHHLLDEEDSGPSRKWSNVYVGQYYFWYGLKSLSISVVPERESQKHQFDPNIKVEEVANYFGRPVLNGQINPYIWRDNSVGGSKENYYTGFGLVARFPTPENDNYSAEAFQKIVSSIKKAWQLQAKHIQGPPLPAQEKLRYCSSMYEPANVGSVQLLAQKAIYAIFQKKMEQAENHLKNIEKLEPNSEITCEVTGSIALGYFINGDFERSKEFADKFESMVNKVESKPHFRRACSVNKLLLAILCKNSKAESQAADYFKQGVNLAKKLDSDMRIRRNIKMMWSTMYSYERKNPKQFPPSKLSDLQPYIINTKYSHLSDPKTGKNIDTINGSIFNNGLNTISKIDAKRFSPPVKTAYKSSYGYSTVAGTKLYSITATDSDGMEIDKPDGTVLVYTDFKYLNKRLVNQYIQAVQRYNNQKNYKKSLTMINKVIELDPYSREAFLRRADIYTALKKHRLALNDFSHLLNIGVKKWWIPNILTDRARCFVNLGEYDKASKEIEKALAKQSDNKAALQIRAKLKQLKKN